MYVGAPDFEKIAVTAARGLNPTVYNGMVYVELATLDAMLAILSQATRDGILMGMSDGMDEHDEHINFLAGQLDLLILLLTATRTAADLMEIDSL
jgi:hypothetical protein